MSKKFLRTGSKSYYRLGRQNTWRRARGRQSKMRENKKNKPPVVTVGYRTPKSERNKINGRTIVRVENFKDAEKVKKGDLVLIAKIGAKKRKFIEEKIKSQNGEIYNKIKQTKNLTK